MAPFPDASGAAPESDNPASATTPRALGAIAFVKYAAVVCCLVALAAFLVVCIIPFSTVMDGWGGTTSAIDVTYEEYAAVYRVVEKDFAKGEHFYCELVDARDSWDCWTKMEVDISVFEAVVAKWTALPYPPTPSLADPTSLAPDAAIKARRIEGEPPARWPEPLEKLPAWWRPSSTVRTSTCWDLIANGHGLGWRLSYDDKANTLWLYMWNRQHWPFISN